MPKQSIPHKAIKKYKYEIMTKLYNDCMILNSYQLINERNINYMNHKRFLFDANVHEKGRRYGISIEYMCGTKVNDNVINNDIDDDYDDDDDMIVT